MVFLVSGSGETAERPPKASSALEIGPSGNGTGITVLTLGTFDLLHYGQISFLRQCQRLGGQLVVGVNSDRFAESYKRRPIMSQAERMEAVRLVMGCKVVLNDGPGRDTIIDVLPDVLAVGSDWARKDYYAQIGCDQDLLDDEGITLAYVPYTRDVSTTDILERIRRA